MIPDIISILMQDKPLVILYSFMFISLLILLYYTIVDYKVYVQQQKNYKQILDVFYKELTYIEYTQSKDKQTLLLAELYIKYAPLLLKCLNLPIEAPNYLIEALLLYFKEKLNTRHGSSHGSLTPEEFNIIWVQIMPDTKQRFKEAFLITILPHLYAYKISGSGKFDDFCIEFHILFEKEIDKAMTLY